MRRQPISDRFPTRYEGFAGCSTASPPGDVVSYTIPREEMQERFRRLGVTGPLKREKKPMTNFGEEAEKRKGFEEMANRMEKEQYLQARLDGKTRGQITTEFGLTPGYLYARLEKWGLKEAGAEQQALRVFAGVHLEPHKAPTAVLMPPEGKSLDKPVETVREPKMEAAEVSETKKDHVEKRQEVNLAVTVTQGSQELEHPHLALLNALHEQFLRKNHDYGDSFHETFQEFGLLASIIRMSDKWGRIKSLSKQAPEVEDETLRDTLLDLANYAVMTVMEMDKQIQ